MLRWLLLLALTVAESPLWAQGAVVNTVRPDGQRMAVLAEPGTKVLVLFFVGTDCPVSNKSFPEMKRVREKFAGRGVRFWFVYPDAGEDAQEVRLHQAVYDAGGEAALDPHGTLVTMTGARVTPEVSVLVPQGTAGWRAVYTGRIDDRYVRIGLERPQATEHYAERVLNAILSGGPVERATGVPVGCAIMNPGVGNAAR